MNDQYKRLVKKATLASTFVATLLIISKLLAWILTGSASMLASLTDSLMDVSASLINLLAAHYATQPADNEHRFGHGKAESLAGIAQAGFIAGSAVLLIFNAADRLINPKTLAQTDVGITVTLLALVLTVMLISYQAYVVKKTGSQVVKADALHYRSDVLLNLGVLAALGASAYGYQWADGALALVIGVYILVSAAGIAIESGNTLLDRELPEEEKEDILRIVREHPMVHGAHEIRTRQAGPTKFIQMHLELPDELSLMEAHRVADEVEKSLERAYPGADVIIHQDPLSMAPGKRRRRHSGS
ncbi:cation diffusion facilitator family transporter [Gallaecimonas kandeliae]|uniref:cation diffusion facilitator family transporter n=1 Tax=Gallaecimonas kandeliae TaxID=3029055 RepID=UPI00264979C9|nr:cation diffusion facilitator family transporter [Gallaecimonas kandeliae]WKE65486.1 cation diffusion facilitator family transporter [Gallaecimonas kandeliae]